MSETYLCKDKNLERNVVVKAVKSGIDPKRLINELKILSSIRSRYVVEVLDVIRDASNNIVGLVEDHLSGADLSHVNTSDAVTALNALYPIIAGVSEIHRHDCLHRDLKPDNMKYDSTGQLKIFDFGLSKSQSNGQTGDLFFTPYYAAPEIFQKNAQGQHEFSPAADIYAFGVIAIWLLNSEILPNCLGNIPPILPCNEADFNAFASFLPDEIIKELNLCLSKNPSDRPTAKSLETIIKRYILRWQHRMTFTYNGTAHHLDKNKKSVKLTSGQCEIGIVYNGLDFIISTVIGDVSINNSTVAIGMNIEGATVIVMRDINHNYPASITANVSHPEVGL